MGTSPTRGRGAGGRQAPGKKKVKVRVEYPLLWVTQPHLSQGAMARSSVMLAALAMVACVAAAPAAAVSPEAKIAMVTNKAPLATSNGTHTWKVCREPGAGSKGPDANLARGRPAQELCVPAGQTRAFRLLFVLHPLPFFAGENQRI